MAEHPVRKKKNKDIASMMDQQQLRAFQAVTFSPRLYSIEQAQTWLDAHEVPATAKEMEFGGITGDLFKEELCVLGTMRGFQLGEGIMGWKCDRAS